MAQCPIGAPRARYVPDRRNSADQGAMLPALGNWPNLDGRWKARIAQFGHSETVGLGNPHACTSAAR
jgi:hypothetical protein